MLSMRTTLTIDDSIAEALKRRAFETGQSFKSVVNEALRKGLSAEPEKPARSSTYRLPKIPMGTPLVDLTKANQIAAELENEELIRKMDLRK